MAMKLSSNPRIEKEYLERKIARDLASYLYPSANAVVVSRRPPYPDVLLQLRDSNLGEEVRIGVELCALLSETEIEASDFESRFLADVNLAINAATWPQLSVALVMQDDREAVTHKAAARFSGYRLLPKYLDALFVFQGGAPPTGRAIGLNQRSSNRPSRGLFPKKAEVPHFAEELQHYLLTLHDSDFFVHPGDGSLIHHAVVAEMAGPVDTPPTQDGRALDDKLSGKKKYDRRQLDQFYLLVHNHPQNTDHAFRVWHPYLHDRGRILSSICARLHAETTMPFDKVYFADYSPYVLGGCDIYEISSTVSSAEEP